MPAPSSTSGSHLLLGAIALVCLFAAAGLALGRGIADVTDRQPRIATAAPAVAAAPLPGPQSPPAPAAVPAPAPAAPVRAVTNAASRRQVATERPQTTPRTTHRVALRSTASTTSPQPTARAARGTTATTTTARAGTTTAPAAATTAPEPQTSTRFRPRPPGPTALTRSIPADHLPADPGEARRLLAARLATLGPNDPARADIGFQLTLARELLDDPRPGRRRAITETLRVNAWWFSRWRAPQRPVIARDAAGLVYTYRAPRGFGLNPVATTGRWQSINSDVAITDLADALLTVGVRRTAGSRSFLAWEYYDVPDRPGAVRPGTSGMAQARVASLLGEAHRLTGRQTYARGARDALISFGVPVDRGGVLSVVSDGEGNFGRWFVERAYPGDDPWKGGALNGFMVALVNLSAAGLRLNAPAAADPEAQLLARQGARIASAHAVAGADALERFLPLHDTGEWSYYGLLTPGRPWRSYLADLNYHCYHVTLLRQLAGRFPERSFAETATAWSNYVDQAATTCPERAGATSR